MKIVIFYRNLDGDNRTITIDYVNGKKELEFRLVDGVTLKGLWRQDNQ